MGYSFNRMSTLEDMTAYTYRHSYGYASLLFFALYGEYLSRIHSIIAVEMMAPTILNQTSKRKTVINLKSDVCRTGFRMASKIVKQILIAGQIVPLRMMYTN